ncbi:AraC family transcriptional regulator [Actinoallomurus sp. CA-150999]|uniref:AraC family transcriptional regulator n=1 Tax=Actinoallomurus sp. CA-150999 TaxID=3239887 RepID=UPI003D943CA8
MSRNSQQGDGTVLVAAFDTAGWQFDRHHHEENQLAWAATGVLTVSTEGTAWVLPPTRALWIPAGVEHVTDADRRTTFHSVYLAAERGPRWTEPTPVTITPLARELTLHLARTEIDPAARRRAEDVLLDQLAAVPATTITVPMPGDPRALDLAQALVADPGDPATLGEWGRRVGAGERTLARIFVAETGMTFGRWRTQARLRSALVLLARGTPVAVVARRVGYATPSAFVAVFHRALGVSPGAYFGTR